MVRWIQAAHCCMKRKGAGLELMICTSSQFQLLLPARAANSRCSAVAKTSLQDDFWPSSFLSIPLASELRLSWSSGEKVILLIQSQKTEPDQLAGLLPPWARYWVSSVEQNCSAFGPHKAQMIPSHLKGIKVFHLPGCNKSLLLKGPSVLDIVINFCWPVEGISAGPSSSDHAQSYHPLQLLFQTHKGCNPGGFSKQNPPWAQTKRLSCPLQSEQHQVPSEDISLPKINPNICVLYTVLCWTDLKKTPTKSLRDPFLVKGAFLTPWSVCKWLLFQVVLRSRRQWSLNSNPPAVFPSFAV